MSIRFLYLRDFDKNRHVTIARRVEHDTVSFQFAISNPTDLFKKKFGRMVSSARLSIKPFYIPQNYNIENKPIETILDFIAKDKEEFEFPMFLRKMAEKELRNWNED